MRVGGGGVFFTTAVLLDRFPSGAPPCRSGPGSGCASREGEEELAPYFPQPPSNTCATSKSLAHVVRVYLPYGHGRAEGGGELLVGFCRCRALGAAHHLARDLGGPPGEPLRRVSW